MSWNQEADLLAGALVFLLKNRDRALQQADLLDQKLASLTVCLNRASQHSQAAFQCVSGLNFLVLWHVSLAYKIYSKHMWHRIHGLAAKWLEMTGEDLSITEQGLALAEIDPSLDDSYNSVVLDRDSDINHESEGQDSLNESFQGLDLQSDSVNSEMDKQMLCFVKWDVCRRES